MAGDAIRRRAARTKAQETRRGRRKNVGNAGARDPPRRRRRLGADHGNAQGPEETMTTGKVYIFDHPLIQHKLTILRDRRTGHKEFRELVEEVAMLMAFEATSDLPIRTVEVTTPLAPARGATLAGREIAVVPILRAGLAMETGILRLIPTARVGHIGIFRDPASLEPRTYYCKLPPDIADRQVLVLDPMLATGGSAVQAGGLLKGRGARGVRLMVLIA